MDAAESLRLVVPGTVGYLDIVRDFVTRVAGSAGFAAGDVDEIVLALDEAVANIVEHAYEKSSLPVERRTLDLEVRFEDGGLIFVLRDRGEPFDPTLAAAVDLERHLASGSKDGLGIHLMRRLMHEIRYRRSDDGNELVLVRRPGSVPGALPG